MFNGAKVTHGASAVLNDADDNAFLMAIAYSFSVM